MDKELQSRCWQCLPKEAREEIRNGYRVVSKNPQLDRCDSVYLTALENIFGQHNLTSDEEPSELLFVERKKVQDLIKSLKTIDDYTNGIRYCAKVLFGDKCLPDEEPSVQVEPKFKVGDKVRVLENAELVDNRGKIAIIVKHGQCCKGYGWVLDISKSVFLESELAPYTEPKYKIDDKVIVTHFNKVGIVRNIKSHPQIGFNYEVETGKDAYLIVHEVGLESYTEPEYRNLSQNIANCDKSEDKRLDNNTGEKELNRKALYDALCELESASIKVRKALISM